MQSAKGVIKIESTALPALIGLEGITELYGVSRNTIYTWKSRGRFGEPDAVVSGKNIWYADRFLDPADPSKIDLGERPPLPLLMGIADVAAAFDVGKNAVEKWHSRTRDAEEDAPTPPPPRLVISTAPIWLPEDWEPFAAATHRPYTPPKPRRRKTK